MSTTNPYQYSFYYDIRNNCERAFMIKPNGEVYDLHGVVINKMCKCGQGVEVRVHATEAKTEGQQPDEGFKLLTPHN